jgi:hypothetical protein
MALVVYNPDAHGVIRPSEWKIFEGDDDSDDGWTVVHLPTKLGYTPMIQIDRDDKAWLIAACEGVPDSALVEARGQEALRYFCVYHNTTPDGVLDFAKKFEARFRARVRLAGELSDPGGPQSTLDRLMFAYIHEPPWAVGMAVTGTRITEDMREHVQNRVLLVFAEDAGDIASLEATLGCTQAEAVDQFVYRSCWNEVLPENMIKTAYDRKVNLRAAMIIGDADPQSLVDREIAAKAAER